MSSQHKRKIKIVTIQDSFFKLIQGVDSELLLIKKEMNRRPCLILVKVKYKGRKYTFALPFRSNIPRSAEKCTYFALPNRNSTKTGNHHGIHYTKAFPIDPKYLIPYKMNGDFYGEFILAYIEKHLNEIIVSFKDYLTKYENGQYHKFHVDIDQLINIQNLK